MLHRHPLLSLLTLLYLGFVGLVTLTPGNEQPDYAGLAGRVLARLQRYPELDPVTSRLLTALANAAQANIDGTDLQVTVKPTEAFFTMLLQNTLEAAQARLA